MTSQPKRQPPRATKKGKDRSQADSAWKDILSDFLQAFMIFSFSEDADKIDWTQAYESLDKEMVEVSEESGFGVQSADKLFKVHLLTGEEKLLLLHIEVQGYKDDNFARRVYDYNDLIRRKYKLEVESFAVLSDPDKNFRPNYYQRQSGRTRLLFEFAMIKLLDWWVRWHELEQNENPFALVVMAHLKTQRLKRRPIELKEAKIQLIRLLFARGYTHDYVLKLLRFIVWLVKLPPALEAEVRQEVKRLNEEVKMPYVTAWEELAKEEGKQEGKQEGLREGMFILLSGQLEQRLGTIEPELKQQLEQLNPQRLQELGKHLFSLTSQADLKAWLQP